jgi:hypothetical protein
MKVQKTFKRVSDAKTNKKFVKENKKSAAEHFPVTPQHTTLDIRWAYSGTEKVKEKSCKIKNKIISVSLFVIFGRTLNLEFV